MTTENSRATRVGPNLLHNSPHKHKGLGCTASCTANISRIQLVLQPKLSLKTRLTFRSLFQQSYNLARDPQDRRVTYVHFEQYNSKLWNTT